jgi:hypothetical protein
MPIATEIAGDGAHIYPYIVGRYSGEGNGKDGAGQGGQRRYITAK